MSKSNQFINYYFYSSESINDSKNNNLFIRKIDKDNINYQLDEKQKQYFNKNVVFWIDKYKVDKSFGMFNLFSYSIENDSYYTLNIGLNNPNDKYKSEVDNQYLIKINNTDYETFSTFTGVKVDNNSILIVDIYNYDTKKKLGEIRIQISPPTQSPNTANSTYSATKTSK
jgi:hypothetical protein